MIFILKSFVLILLCLLFSNCTGNNRRSSENIQFRDNGRTIDSLKAVYGFESAEFENWEEDDKTDSTLTVCFINSKKLPQNSLGETAHEYVAIASSIHNSVLNYNKYKSYYIIFLKRDKEWFFTVESHTAGMDVSVKYLPGSL